MNVNRWSMPLLLALLLALLAGCANTPTSTSDGAAVAVEQQANPAPSAASEAAIECPEGWNDASHGNAAEPNYAVVFPQNKVNQLTITPAALANRYNQLGTLLAPYAAEENGEAACTGVVEQLTLRTTERAEAVDAFLATQP